ncbi:MAG TPA: hypothetical protein VGC88_02010 [Terriglobales bacterium]
MDALIERVNSGVGPEHALDVPEILRTTDASSWLYQWRCRRSHHPTQVQAVEARLGYALPPLYGYVSPIGISVPAI